MKLSKLTKPELDRIKECANFTDDEVEIFELLAKGKSITEISYSTNISCRTVSRRINGIYRKIGRLYEVYQWN